MKKILLLMVAAAAIFATAMAQERRTGDEKKVFLIISAGPSFPVGDFKSKMREDLDLPLYTKTGINFDLQGGYHFSKYFGVTGSIFYNLHAYDEGKLHDYFNDQGLVLLNSITVDHWKMHGLVIGPMVTATITPKVFADLNVMTGVINANSPKLTVYDDVNSIVLLEEDWAVAVPLRVSGAMRFQFGSDYYFSVGANYFYAEPEFKLNAPLANEVYVGHQKLTTFNVTAGIGMRF